MRMLLGSVFALAVSAVQAQAAPPPGPGAETYAEHCASCHGAEGQPELPERVLEHVEASLESIYRLIQHKSGREYVVN